MVEYYIIHPETYDEQFWWKKDDIEFWKSLLLHPSKTVLELAAGTGRLAVPLLREGSYYTGLELSDQYVNFANAKFPDRNPIIQGDMRSFNLQQKYDFIFIGFNSFLHLLSENEIKQCLSSIKQHMHEKSRVYIDVFIPDTSFLYRSSSSEFIMEFFDSKENCNSQIDESIVYDSSDEIISVIWNYCNIDNKKVYNVFNFKMKAIYPDTMNRILVDNGFKVRNLWGSYDKLPINESSLIQIYELGLF